MKDCQTYGKPILGERTMHRARGSIDHRGRSGYSLVEVFLAAVIIAVGFIGIAGALCYAAMASRLAQETMVAETLAAGVLAEARDRGYSQLRSWYTYAGETGVSGLEKECGEWVAQSGLPVAEAWLTVTDVGTDLKGVSVVITWGVARPGGKVETETLMSPRF